MSVVWPFFGFTTSAAMVVAAVHSQGLYSGHKGIGCFDICAVVMEQVLKFWVQNVLLHRQVGAVNWSLTYIVGQVSRSLDVGLTRFTSAGILLFGHDVCIF